jgi:Bardet-Biedl syndrome 5 protein
MSSASHARDRIANESQYLQRDVEDTKAGKYERGRLLITTLRLMWMSSHSSVISLCIGMETIHKLDVTSKARSGAGIIFCTSLRIVLLAFHRVACDAVTYKSCTTSD